MAYLIHIALALAALAAAEEGFTSGAEHPLVVVLLAGVPHYLAWFDRQAFVRGRFRLAAACYRALAWSPPLLFAVAQLLCGWSQTVEDLVGARPSLLGWPHPSALLSLAPFALYTFLAIDARARVADVRAEEIARQRRFQMRMFLSSLVPFLLFVLATWLAGLDPRVRANIENVALLGGLFALLLVVVAIVTLPWLLRRTWDTTPMPAGATRSLLEGFARAIGFECRELVVWNTGYQMANAAVVGVGHGKVVMFSDLLLSQLPPRELLAVFAHEIGHVVRHHVIVFVAWSLAVFISVDLAVAWTGIEDEWAGMGVLGLAVAVWYFAFGWFSRRTELDADLHSIAVTGDVEAMVRALELVGSPHTRSLASWRHFSTERRVAFLRAAQLDPTLGLRLRRKLARLGRVGLALGAAAIAAEAWTLARSFDEDRVRVALALDDTPAAVERLARVERPDPDLARLVELAHSEPVEIASPPLLRRWADAAGATSRLQYARDLYELARLRGEPDLDDEIAELDRRLRTGSR